MSAQPNLNPKNKQAQQVYNGEAPYPTYVVEIQEINLRFGKVLLDVHPQPPINNPKEEKREHVPQVTQEKHPT